MTDYRKMAEEIEHAHYCVTVCSNQKRLATRIEEALRTTSSQAYREGWNKAVEECAKIATRKIGIYQEIAKRIKVNKERLKEIDELGMTVGGIKMDMIALRKPEGMA